MDFSESETGRDANKMGFRKRGGVNAVSGVFASGMDNPQPKGGPIPLAGMRFGGSLAVA
jgi:hypothetical protein